MTIKERMRTRRLIRVTKKQSVVQQRRKVRAALLSKKWSEELIEAAKSIVMYFNGKYNQHRHERGGMPLLKAVVVLKQEMTKELKND